MSPVRRTSSWIMLRDRSIPTKITPARTFPPGSTLQSHAPLERALSFLFRHLRPGTCRVAARHPRCPGTQRPLHGGSSSWLRSVHTVRTEQMPFISTGQRLAHQSAGWKDGGDKNPTSLLSLSFFFFLFFCSLLPLIIFLFALSHILKFLFVLI